MGRMLEITTKVGADAFVVQRFNGREELGRLFEYELELLSERADITAEQLLGSNATVALELGDGAGQRDFNGYVTRFTVQGAVRTPAFKSGSGYLYLITLSPGLWFRTRSSNSQIFPPTTIAGLVTQQLQADQTMGIDSQIGETEKRDYIVQYRETDFNFVSRLLEHTGIYYYFTHEDGSHKMVLVDEAGKHKPAPGQATISFTGEAAADAALQSLRLVSEVQSGAFATGDYNYVTPNTQIAAVSADPKPHDNAGFEIFDFPADTGAGAFAARYAKIRSEELARRYAVVRGSATARQLQVGFKTKVENHSIAALNQEYLVVSHSFMATNNLAQSAAGAGASFQCEFEAIPSGTQFRPARLMPRPTIAGTQTALVVSDFRNDTDASDGKGANLARVKVEFHWDRYGKQSCWARVSTPWAGKGYGFQNMPRVGEEVLVQFIEGDPDRPVVIGRVYNAENKPPFKLPANASITGLKTLSIDDSGNSVAGSWSELRFDDKSGEEQIYVQAQRDFDRRVLNDEHTWVGNESHNYVQADTFDKFDADHHVQTTGDHNEKIGGSLSFDVSSDVHLKAGSNFLGEAGSEVHLKGGAKVIIEGGAQVTLKVGGNFIDINSGGIFIKGTMVMVNSGGSAGSGTAAAPIAPKDAKIAMTSDGGDPIAAPTPPTPPKAFSPLASSFKFAAVTGAALVPPECAEG
ncbi:MAG: type VI secretion system tip protein TssI/VgrG [Burkholderiaceae bacterium]